MAQQLLTAATATNGKPSAATDGVSLREFWGDEEVALFVKSTAGSGTMTVTLRLWLRSIAGGEWAPAGVGADATKGRINAGSALGETDTDKIQHTEIIDNLRHYERAYLEVEAIGGTATAISAWLHAQPARGR